MKQIFVAIALYLAATLSAAASTVTFDDLAFGGVAAPLIRLGGTAEEFEIDASSGLFADGAGVLSTNFDSDAMIVDFAGPQKSVTFTGGLTGEAFDWLSGMITLSAGGDSMSYVLSGGAPESFLFSTGAPFISLFIEIDSFDVAASSVAFVSLTSVTPSPVPLPAGALLLFSGLGLVAVCRYLRT